MARARLSELDMPISRLTKCARAYTSDDSTSTDARTPLIMRPGNFDAPAAGARERENWTGDACRLIDSLSDV